MSEKGGGSYDDLVNAGIDSLNRAEQFRGTDLKSEERVVRARKALFAEWWFQLLALLAVLSVLSSVYFRASAPNVLSIEEAEQQVREFFGPRAEDLADIDS